MFLIDTLLIGGLRFVLDKVAAAAGQELNDEERLREELLAAQMRVELGEMSEAEFASLERDVVARLREIRAAREGETATGVVGGPAGLRVTGVEATVGGDEHEE
jgi:Gas vesicle protein G